jgi:hypothetical protein
VALSGARPVRRADASWLARLDTYGNLLDRQLEVMIVYDYKIYDPEQIYKRLDRKAMPIIVNRFKRENK